MSEHEVLADQIAEWAEMWHDVAESGGVDADFGMEWRHALERFLAMGDDLRSAWHAMPLPWKLDHVNFPDRA